MRRLFLAVVLVAGTLAFTAPAAFASCSGVGITLADGNSGSGNTKSWQTTGTCSNPAFAIGNLNNFAGTCIGFLGINQGDWSDCANSWTLFGSWPSRGTLRIHMYTDINFGGNVYVSYSCTNSWHNLTGFTDQISSFAIIYDGSGGCT